jgi:hypothetical protein
VGSKEWHSTKGCALQLTQQSFEWFIATLELHSRRIFVTCSREDYMRISSYRKWKQIACLVFSLALPMSEVAAASSQPLFSPEQLPIAPPQDQSQPSATQTPSPQPGAVQSSSDQSQNGIARPVGTAAAPAEPVNGVAATRPVGAAIAPAKQRCARVILIRMSIVIGAAVAVGTVVALTRASPSRPN